MISPSSLSEGHPINTMQKVKASTKMYLIMMDFDPLLSLKVINK